MNMTTAEKLKRLTRLHCMTKVSREAGISRQFLHRIIRRNTNISAATAVALARALEVDAGWLIDTTRGWPPVRTRPLEDLKEQSAHAA
jgi:transcriptional regulator with XRE-family HTH domain